MKRKTARRRRSSRSRTKARVKLFLVLWFLIIALFVGTLLMLPTAFQTTDAETGETKQWLAVETLSVEGNTRYNDDAIIGTSGIKIGQSVFSVNKNAAVKKIKSAFPYAETVEIDIDFKRNATIKITEAEELCAVYAANKESVDGKWMVVGQNGQALMYLPIESERPFRRLYLKGAAITGDTLGEVVLHERDLAIVREICAAMQNNGLTGVGEIDLSDRANIRLNWKNQIIVALGNDSNLTYEIAATVSAIPKILSRHGDTATGVLNLSQYSDNTVSSPVIVFTPSSILNADKVQTAVPENDKTTATTTTTAAR